MHKHSFVIITSSFSSLNINKKVYSFVSIKSWLYMPVDD